MSGSHFQQANRRSPFGELLHQLRTARGLTQEQLAESTGDAPVSPRSITNYEKRARNPQDWVIPHRPALRSIADAMQLDLVDRHQIAVAWEQSRKQRDAKQPVANQSGFIPAGRQFAVQQINDAWQKAQNGNPQLVLLGGIAGIGKSTLARYISDEIAANTKEVMISWGAASSWATDIEPYLPFRIATDSILVEPEATSTLPGSYPSRPKLGNGEIRSVVESIPFLAGAVISEYALQHLAEQSSDQDRETITSLLASRSSTNSTGRLDEYSRLLQQFSKSWPLVFVLEDLHWAGNQTITLLMHLAAQLQHMQKTPILLICTFRNDEVYSDSDHPMLRLLDLVSNSPQVTSIMLNESISHTYGMDFVRATVDKTPMADAADTDALAEYLFDQTSGHPLLTNELTRHLQESESLIRLEAGKWEFVPEKIPHETPGAISSFIARRLNRVSEQGKRILEIASVMNDVIPAEIIAEVMKEDEDVIIERIDKELVETHQLLLSAPSIKLLQRDATNYHFPHALFREHIYNQISKSRKRRLHKSIASAMETNSSEFDSVALSEITSHYALAEDWQQAQMSGYRLALNAAFKMDWDLAEIWFPQAESLALKAQDHKQLWQVRAASMSLLRGTGKYEEAIELGESLLKVTELREWPDTVALTYHYLGEVHYDRGQVERATQYLEKALVLHEQSEKHDFAAAALAMLSHATYRQARFDVARAYALRALEISKTFTNFWVEPEAHFALANCEIDLGFYEDALRSYSNIMDLTNLVGKEQTRFIAIINTSLIHVFTGNYQEAVDLLIPAIEHMESVSRIRYVPYAKQYLGFAYEGLGRNEQAAENFAFASNFRRTASYSPLLMDSVAGEIRVAISMGKDSFAQSLLDEATTHLDEHGIEGIEYPLLVYRSVAQAKAHFGDDEGYARYIILAHDLLMERARMIQDEASRTSFLTNVRVHAEVQKLYAELNETTRTS